MYIYYYIYILYMHIGLPVSILHFFKHICVVCIVACLRYHERKIKEISNPKNFPFAHSHSVTFQLVLHFFLCAEIVFGNLVF